MQKRVVFNANQVKPFSPPGSNGDYASRLLIDEISVGSDRLLLNSFILKAGCQTYQGDHGEGYDEAYYIRKGEGVLYLENMETGEYEPFPVSEDSYAFIKGGRGHYLVNTGETDLILLTFMPQNPPRGVNTLYDARLETWGTSFKLLDEE